MDQSASRGADSIDLREGERRDCEISVVEVMSDSDYDSDQEEGEEEDYKSSYDRGNGKKVDNKGDIVALEWLKTFVKQ